MKNLKAPILKGRNYLFGTITHVLTNRNVAALTFDDGPHPTYTPELLRILKYHKVKATFFLIGELAYEHFDVVKKIADDNHAIGNHSWNHKPFPDMAVSNLIHQVKKCSAALSPYGVKLFRPPFGYQSLRTRLYMAAMGYKVVTWNVVGFDWADNDGNQIAETLSKKVKPGCIILLHDNLYNSLTCNYVKRENMLEGLIKFLEVHRKTYEFVTVPELLNNGKPHFKNWIFHPDRKFLNSLTKA